MDHIRRRKIEGVICAAMSLMTVALAGAFAEAAWAGPLEDGRAAHTRKDYQGAMALFRPLADAGNAAAECEVGQLYAEGMGIAANKDQEGARQWFQKAADHGNAQAQSQLGFYYLQKGQAPAENRIERDGAYQLSATQMRALAQSLEWFHKAGDQGDARALWRLGRAYDTGLGGPDGLGGAYGAGDPRNLDRLIFGFGVPRDYVQAYKWLSVAADSGIASIASQRDVIAAKLTPEQLSEGKRQAAQWRAHHPVPTMGSAC